MNESIKLIIADDHPIFRDGLNVVLKRHDFISKITQASDGSEVIRLLESELYDVVLMDIKMVPMNGVQATEIIRSRFPDVKIIALNEMISKGASGYLLKNSDKTEIIQAIKNVIKGRTYFSKEVADFIVDRVVELKSGNADLYKYSEDRLTEVIFLISHEKTSKEIASLMNLSVRTIDECRIEVMKKTNSKSAIGVLKYAMQHGIFEDVILKGKYGI